MVIKKLILNNFGVYAGRNVFDFVHQKPIVLIGGMNGRGKTTFLEAILLALYDLIQLHSRRANIRHIADIWKPI